jgi:hypothetical protein
VARVDRDLARAARAGQPRPERGVVADDGRVDIAEAIDLRRAEEADVDQSALQVKAEQLRTCSRVTPGWSESRRISPSSSVEELSLIREELDPQGVYTRSNAAR